MSDSPSKGELIEASKTHRASRRLFVTVTVAGAYDTVDLSVELHGNDTFENVTSELKAIGFQTACGSDLRTHAENLACEIGLKWPLRGHTIAVRRSNNLDKFIIEKEPSDAFDE